MGPLRCFFQRSIDNPSSRKIAWKRDGSLSTIRVNWVEFFVTRKYRLRPKYALSS
jgi:hypothetical protein